MEISNYGFYGFQCSSHIWCESMKGDVTKMMHHIPSTGMILLKILLSLF